ncbi:MAG: hypothetical protein JSS32_06170 [Verrucomicrobia bacterium]|nr:hypothetical protein [Verrucomicrobiota bacterium]
MHESLIAWKNHNLKTERTFCSFFCTGILFNSAGLYPNFEIEEEIDHFLQKENEFLFFQLNYNYSSGFEIVEDIIYKG